MHPQMQNRQNFLGLPPPDDLMLYRIALGDEIIFEGQEHEPLPFRIT